MKTRMMAAAILAVVLAAAASTASGGTKAAKATTLTVWLQVDAQSGWENVVQSATRAFNAKHPDVNVKVQYQTWGDHLTKFDAAIAGGDAPDVIEFGNTETTKYMAAGAFRQITPPHHPHSPTSLQRLEGCC